MVVLTFGKESCFIVINFAKSKFFIKVYILSRKGAGEGWKVLQTRKLSHQFRDATDIFIVFN